MKAKDKDLRAMDMDGLKKELQELLKAQFNLRIQKSHQQLQNTSLIRKTRREIARVRTIMTQKAASK
ncbi:50S ribosomal protein L29 [Turicimonas muris]|uniref:Large ribosomal subunit protein uL29 n=2 Tax=Turicimonas muris TaxID=1796652 RepID=A0A227KKE4_9BURK|nr:50S ribosomal protein L29 [Turicimonas muris]ANU66924.1 50S ribosomal protein L29 [Burkholderiales bacterium YL45]MBS4767903.1 50S ribosomal protein L29 [Burkholderiales bacterium]MBS4846335.1 50S ribosomal protein L29 [Burkholderiales bacterium]OXE47552.1 50S ribosomal protein L29 [Turicimonas muris]QQQ95787.1 50S ribosomal protein L29 [Turicimonas muris]